MENIQNDSNQERKNTKSRKMYTVIFSFHFFKKIRTTHEEILSKKEVGRNM